MTTVIINHKNNSYNIRDDGHENDLLGQLFLSGQSMFFVELVGCEKYAILIRLLHSLTVCVIVHISFCIISILQKTRLRMY